MIRLTRAGLLVVIAGTGLLAVGRVFGLLELFVLGTAALALVASAAVAARRRRIPLTVTRTIRAPRVHAGGQVGVHVAVKSTGTRTSPVMLLTDPVLRRAARLLVGPLAPGKETSSEYVLTVGRRGRLTVGPMAASVVDPFGLARATIEAAGATELLVVPHIDVVQPPPRTPATEAVSGQGGGQGVLLGAGGEFHSLSVYRPGDDLRRVHWPSSMRRDDLMIRNHEQPWDGVTTVVLDQATVAGEMFEAAVSAAASIAAASIRARHRVRLLTSSGWDSGFGSGPAHRDRILHELALVEPEASSMATALTLAGRHGGAVAVVSAEPVDRVGCARQLSAAGSVVLVAPGLDVVPGPGFAARWNAHVVRARVPAPTS